MISKAVVAVAATYKESAESGVDFSSRHGARCPACGERARIYKTMPWDGNLRVRYHKCTTKGCLLAALGVSIKSIEEDK